MSADYTLSGVGMGPGDSDHVTVKALRTLGAADVILMPSTETCAGGVGCAKGIVCAHLPARAGVVRRTLSFTAERHGTGQRRADVWEASTMTAVEAFKAGTKRVAFATVDDVLASSTSSYLCDLVSRRVEVEVEVVPKITAMQAIATASRTPLIEGQEILSLVSWTVRPEALAHVYEVSDTVVIYKGGRETTELHTVLDAQGRLGETVPGTGLGLPPEHLVPLSEVTDCAPYFDAVLAASRRSTTGGRI